MINFKLMSHQQDALEKSFKIPDLFLAFEVGTGKSCAVLQILRHKCASEKRLLRTLVLCPKIMVDKWQDEIEKFTQIKTVHKLKGAAKKRLADLNKIGKDPAVIITNYDVLTNKDLFKEMLAYKPEVLICDESHLLKNYKSKRAVNVCAIADKARFKFLLTGTPILNSSLDLYMQYRILDGNRDPSTFACNYFSFRHQYFVDLHQKRAGMQGYYPKFVERKEMHDVLNKKIKEKMLVITKEECLDLPPLVVQEYNVELTSVQNKHYKQMARDYVTFVNSELGKGIQRAVVANMAMTKLLRLQQIVSGFVKTEDNVIVRIENNRISALRGLLETITYKHKVIIWAIFKENYKMIAELCDELDLQYAIITGDTKDKTAEMNKFNDDPDVKVLIGNPGAGGVGIDLIAASYMIYYSRGYKLGDDIQSEARNHRKGSEIHKKITRINLVSPGTVDELVSEALKNKLNISEEVIGWRHKL